MKKIKLFSTLLAAVLLFTACNTEVNKAIFEPSCDGVSFLSTVYVDTEIPASNATIDITLTRATADASLTVSLSNNLPAEIVCPSSVTFNAGEYEANIKLDVSKMDIGVQKKGTISFDGSDISDENMNNTAVSCTLAKAYTWVSLGKGFFYDGFWEGFIGEVEIMKADGFDRYRVVDPYAASQESTGKNPANLDFWVTNADGNVQWDTFTTGFDYDGTGTFIKGYWPSDLNAKYASKEVNSKFYEKDIIVFDPCWYMDGVGGWPTSFYPFVVCLPGRTLDSFKGWLEANEM